MPKFLRASGWVRAPQHVYAVVSSRDDASLVAGARTGSDDAARALFRRHWPAVWRAAYAVTFDVPTADDVAQETFIRAFARLERIDPPAFAAWLRRVAINRAVDELRRRRRVTPEDAVVPARAAAGPTETDPGVVAAVAALAPPQRVVVVLHYWLDYSAEEIARVLELPVGTVGSRLSRALAELRSTLEVEHVRQP